jgi:hypothetical protein
MYTGGKMKKIICVVLVLCFTCAFVLGPAKPVFAETSDIVFPVVIVVGALVVLSYVGGVIMDIINGADKDRRSKELAKTWDQVYVKIPEENNAMVNIMTYAGLLQKKGKPTKVTDTAKTRVVIYDLRALKAPKPVENTDADAITPTSKPVSTWEGIVWTYTFDKSTKTLAKWKYEDCSGDMVVTSLSGPDK